MITVTVTWSRFSLSFFSHSHRYLGLRRRRRAPARPPNLIIRLSGTAPGGRPHRRCACDAALRPPSPPVPRLLCVAHPPLHQRDALSATLLRAPVCGTLGRVYCKRDVRSHLLGLRRPHRGRRHGCPRDASTAVECAHSFNFCGGLRDVRVVRVWDVRVRGHGAVLFFVFVPARDAGSSWGGPLLHRSRHCGCGDCRRRRVGLCAPRQPAADGHCCCRRGWVVPCVRSVDGGRCVLQDHIR